MAGSLLSIRSLLLHFVLPFVFADLGLVDEEGLGPDSPVFLLRGLDLPLAQLQVLPGLLQLALLGLEDELAILILVEVGLDQVRLVEDLRLLLVGRLGGRVDLPRRPLDGLGGLAFPSLGLAVHRVLRLRQGLSALFLLPDLERLPLRLQLPLQHF